MRCHARGVPDLRDAERPGLKFCGECGTPLAASAPRQLRPRLRRPDAERRLVSVLFADLVGFTTLSEDRDAEEVRDLLSRYFETARQVIERYGGTVEKFIGDAVMAVWGAPVAHEDDAERAVRAALELIAAVAALGGEVGAPDFAPAPASLTGEAAVTLGAEGQGMVAGDLVNTASRVQSAATPGTVLVGEATRRATEAAIVYEDAGEHELKGKAEPVELWRALRVVAGPRRRRSSTGLEAPFVGRDRELRLVKDLFHATAEERRAHLVSVIGVAGIGKSRLGWEFFKYIDGLVETSGGTAAAACLRRGRRVLGARRDGADACRHRRGRAPSTARAKLREPSSRRRRPGGARWIEPRLAPCWASRSGRPRPRGPLRGLAPLLRAARRGDPDRPRVRGPALGRRRPARLHRVPARVVAELPDLRPHARAAGALERRPTWGAGTRSFTRSTSSRCRRGE